MSDNLDKAHLAKSRRIVESGGFTKDFRALVGQYPLLRELYIAIKHELQTHAHINPNQLQGIYWKDTKPLYGTPVFSVTYTFDEDKVYLSSILIVPDDEL